MHRTGWRLLLFLDKESSSHYIKCRCYYVVVIITTLSFVLNSINVRRENIYALVSNSSPFVRSVKWQVVRPTNWCRLCILYMLYGSSNRGAPQQEWKMELARTCHWNWYNAKYGTKELSNTTTHDRPWVLCSLFCTTDLCAPISAKPRPRPFFDAH